MLMKLKNMLDLGDKTLLTEDEDEEIELGRADVEEHGKQTGDRKDGNSISIKQFAMHLNLHGIRYCFDNQTFRRIFWIILLLTSLSIFFYFLCASITMYLTYPYYTVSINKNINKLKYPAISICNRNDMRLSMMNGTKLHFMIQQGTGNPENLTMNEYTNMILNASHRIEDMLYSCKVGWRQTCKSRDFKAFTLSTGTSCFTLNSGEQGKLELLDVTNVGSYGTALTITINVQQYDYYPDIDGVGIYLIIHGANELPSHTERQLISPGTFTQVNIKKHQIKHLPPPYSKCGTKKLKYFKKYTVQHCYLERLADHVVSECGCRDMTMPGNAGKLCTSFDQLKCVWPAWSKFDEQFKRGESCPSPCVIDKYSVTSTFSLFPSNNVADKMAAKLNRTEDTVQERRQFIRENFLKLLIAYTDLSYELTEQVPIYNTAKLLGMIGGLMALFLGASLLTFLEIIGFILEKSFSRRKRK